MARKPSARRPKRSSKSRKPKALGKSGKRRPVTANAKGSAIKKTVGRSKARPQARAKSKASPSAKARTLSAVRAKPSAGAKQKPPAAAKPKPSTAAKPRPFQHGAKFAARPKSAPPPIPKSAKPGVKSTILKSRLAMKGGVRSGNGMQGTLEFESEPAVVSFGAEHALPPMPTRRRSAAKPGSPDWPGESLTVGMPAPEFSLPSTLGRKVTLAEFRGKRVILYFYPKDDTPGCTMEACAFRDHLPRIQSKDAVVLGISLDDELSHQRFAQKYNLPFALLSDVDAAVSRQYGTYKEKNLYGRSYWGIERTTFVVDREGRVENVFRRVKVEGHAEEVMATLAVL